MWPIPGLRFEPPGHGRVVVAGAVQVIVAFCLSLSGDKFRTGEISRQELAGPVRRSGRFVEDWIKGLEDVRHPRGDVEGDFDVGGGGSLREADGVVQENLVASGLDDQGRQAGQVSEYRADEAETSVLARRIVADPGLEGLPAEKRVGPPLGFHGRPGQGEIGMWRHDIGRGRQG